MIRLAFLLSLLLPLALAGDQLDERGWNAGTPAARSMDAMTPKMPVALDLPALVTDRLKRRTFVLYFSPTCGHCKNAAPEIALLSRDETLEMDFLGVASGNSNPGQIEQFAEEYGLDFPIIIDTERDFARAAGTRSTPAVLILEPSEGGGAIARDAYLPWFVGAGAILKMRRVVGDPFSAFTPGAYQGGVVCASCHSEEAESWLLTHHSVAYRTLYTRDRAGDLACVGCHVTGLDEPTGFQMGDHRSALASVTCEACHSAGGPHDGEAVEASSTCEGCHDADHSVAFSYEKGLPHIDHYLANAMSEAEQTQRWRDLASGELEKPLLAFPEGENIGAETCKSCHTEQHKDWRKDRHRKAMSALTKPQAGTVECVRCHATPVSSGPEPEAVDGYRVEEGVSCESCHGPGEGHAAEPKKDNIIGLGESCPECVIEEICTSCHTKKWDPSWELKKRLKDASH